MQSRWWLALLMQTIGQVPLSAASPSSPSSSSSSSATGPFLGTPDDAFWYDLGWYGVRPLQHFASFGASPSRPYFLLHDERCSAKKSIDDTTEGEDLIFVAPRGLSVGTPAPTIYDTRGNLVWMDTQWGQAMGVTVQQYRGEDFLTFWHGTDNGTFGEGKYYMLNSSYDVVHTMQPAPLSPGEEPLLGDLHDFVITDEGTALMTIYQKRPYDLTAGYGIKSGWIFDSLFQEVDIATGKLIFSWRASDHFAIHDTLAPLKRGFGRRSDKAFDFFHINSLGKTSTGDYIVSSRYMCAVACISGSTGAVLWQLGGRHNSFADISSGEATNMHGQHHAVWHEDTQELTVFDNGAFDKLTMAAHSRALRVRLTGIGGDNEIDDEDVDESHDKTDGKNNESGEEEDDDDDQPTAELVQAYVSPESLRAPSQGSVQILDATDTVLVGWGHVPAYTEFSADEGKPLCNVHLCPLGFTWLGWCKNYRVFKHHWVGRPSTLPSAAMRPDKKAVYVSWNGATEVRHWQLEIATIMTGGDAQFTKHGNPVEKDGFEARLAVPSEAKRVRIAALDVNGLVLAYSAAVSTSEKTVVPVMYSPPLKETMRQVVFQYAAFISLGIAGAVVLVYLAVRHRVAILTRARKVTALVITAVIAVAARVLPSRAYKYEALPTTTMSGMTELRTGERQGSRQEV
ncbi:hypothetical protein SBRCBS47491_000622 [Sporothrix bragantina]|uniref:Arylsulfotransferase protein n=1 Tax=Sporothrix bragantina TaxID=671064 RepID=A0ABP0ARS2_9PEZI